MTKESTPAIQGRTEASSPDFEINGWSYGHVAGVSRKPDVRGKAFKLLLYAIRPDKKRLFVGQLEQCVGLTTGEARKACRLLDRSGAIDRMIRDIKAVSGNARIVRGTLQRTPSEVINIRFRPHLFDWYSDLLVPPTSSVAEGSKNARYQLNEASDKEVRLWLSVINSSGQAKGGENACRIAGALEGIQHEVTWIRRTASRALRDKVFNAAGGKCEACTKDFSKVLSGKGVRVLHVHHRKQRALQDRPAITNAEDLAVVCANRHMLLHLDPKNAMPVEQLRRLLKGEDRN